MKSVEQIKEKEAKRLIRYQAQRDWKPYKGYFVIVIILITLAAAVDEMCSNINGDLQSLIVTEFIQIPQNIDYNKAADQFVLFTTLASVSSLISPFYKSLADKLGRKLFLWLNVLGMAIGLFLCYWSPNFAIYLLGFFIISFFVTHDMQVVYIFEIAPENKRATLYGATKCVGTLSVILIPLLRKAFITSDDIGSWRKVFLIPACLAFLFAILIFFLAKETNVFLDNRIAYLKRPYEERQKEIEEAKKKKSDTVREGSHKTGVFPAIKYIFSHKDLRWVAITQMIVGLSFAPLSSYYTSIMRDFKWEESSITDALLLFSTIYALSMLLAGICADHVGRKKVIVVCLSFDVLGFLFFVFGSKYFWNAYLVGVVMSLYRSGLYIAYDYLTLIASEMCPTEIRGSVMGGQSLCSYLCVAIGLGLVSLVLMNLVTGFACLTIGLPFAVISLVIAIVFLKDSKGVNLEAIK